MDKKEAMRLGRFSPTAKAMLAVFEAISKIVGEPEMSDNKEELKPCPFCGKSVEVEHWEGDGDIVDPPCIGESFTLEEWNNAYCWKELDRLRALNERYKKIVEEYATHEPHCILNRWEAGEPTPDGGYRSKYAGKWYQSKPVDETPKCNCGLDSALTETEEKSYTSPTPTSEKGKNER